MSASAGRTGDVDGESGRRIPVCVAACISVAATAMAGPRRACCNDFCLSKIAYGETCRMSIFANRPDPKTNVETNIVLFCQEG
jgi:hypothetical protein